MLSIDSDWNSSSVLIEVISKEHKRSTCLLQDEYSNMANMMVVM